MAPETSRMEWLAHSRLLPVVCYALAATVVAVIGLHTGFAAKDLSIYDLIGLIAAAVPAGFLLLVSLTDLACYFIFIPSIARDGHLFSDIHGMHLVHPLTTSVVLGLLALCIFSGSWPGWTAWALLVAAYLAHTVVIIKRASQEHLVNGLATGGSGTLLMALNLVLGTELVTLAGGARPLAPWRLSTLPESTWIVDVRTKPEFHWNRMLAAENYPWGIGLVEAAKDKPKDTPVLVTCFTGHRSPTVAVMLRKLGFTTVYNLNWGLLYLILLERGHKTEGPFGLTRPHRDPQRRGEDLKGISAGYVTLETIILVLAPLENYLRAIEVPLIAQIAGALLFLAGLTGGVMSFLALGRNFRVFAAPRRSGTLITTGIYARVRHPMYTSAVTLFAGYILLWGSVLAVPLWLAFSVLYVIKAVKEERILMSHYPEYGEYMKRSGRFLPFV